MKRSNFEGNKTRRKKEADERNAKWRALSPEQQLAELDKLGVRAVKQRARINKQIEAKGQ